MDKMKKVVKSYIFANVMKEGRVSSKKQEQEGYSIPAQLKLLNDYALNFSVLSKV